MRKRKGKPGKWFQKVAGWPLLEMHFKSLRSDFPECEPLARDKDGRWGGKGWRQRFFCCPDSLFFPRAAILWTVCLYPKHLCPQNSCYLLCQFYTPLGSGYSLDMKCRSWAYVSKAWSSVDISVERQLDHEDDELVNGLIYWWIHSWAALGGEV